MANRDHIREWLNKAESDYQFASQSLDHDTEFFAQVCFLFQQSAEKFLKSYIVASDLPFKPIHNLIVLGSQCASHAPSAASVHDACLFLNPFYIDTRYPVHWPSEYSLQVARQAQDAVVRIRTWVTNTLGVNPEI